MPVGALAALLVLAAGGCSTDGGSRESAFASAGPVTVAPAPVPTADVSDLRDVPPAGPVTILDGPFGDALRWNSVTFRPGTAPTVTGQVSSRVEVAPLLRLEVRASFYDAAGRDIGRATFAAEGGGTEGGQPHEAGGGDATSRVVTLRPAVPLPAAAASARLAVVQFVTE